MVTHLNSFSLTCEQRGARDGSVNRIEITDRSYVSAVRAALAGPEERL